MQIYEELKKDHKKVRELLDELLMLSDEDDSHEMLVDQIRDELIPHARAEEAVLYNSLRALNSDDGQVMHGYKEHLEAERLLRTLQVKDKVNVEWKKTARQLKDALEHHIAQEEGPIFALARKTLTDEEAEKIGAAFVQLKAKVEDQGIAGSTLEMVKNLMPPKLSKALGMTP